ncbi:MAG: hypothetical protein P9L92_14010 [Candidatus Electryonea clarkiae]|nr:hypothetical protein [Candidatus Electryonea clarkiae]MDP8286189.1 hypothetical protein [Candidatus Electryonea clarkiae]
MKQTLTILLALFAVISFYGCGKDNPTGNSEKQVMFVYANHYSSYLDDQTGERVNEGRTNAWGVVHSVQIPEFESIKLGETVFSGDEWYEFYPGYLYIKYRGDDYSNARITSDYNPLDVEVKTSLGRVKGRISLPDTLTTLTLSEYDTLQLGESFTISWSGSNAEFYEVSYLYSWPDEDGIYNWEDMFEFVTENSITFPGSMFSHDGRIYGVGVQPMNGPLPKGGAVGNMSGEGSGFLYYMNEGTYYEGDDIIIGSGVGEDMAKMSSNEQKKRVNPERISEQIENKILGNQE